MNKPKVLKAWSEVLAWVVMMTSLLTVISEGMIQFRLSISLIIGSLVLIISSTVIHRLSRVIER